MKVVYEFLGQSYIVIAFYFNDIKTRNRGMYIYDRKQKQILFFT